LSALSAANAEGSPDAFARSSLSGLSLATFIDSATRRQHTAPRSLVRVNQLWAIAAHCLVPNRGFLPPVGIAGRAQALIAKPSS
jgi:hypothetical protein